MLTMKTPLQNKCYKEVRDLTETSIMGPYSLKKLNLDRGIQWNWCR